MSTLSLGTLAILIAFPVGTGLYIAWRISRLARGVQLRVSLLILFAIIYVGLFLFSERVEWLRFPILGEALDTSLLVIGIYLAARYLRVHAEFERTPEGRWVFRASVVVLLIWFFLFVGRLLIEVVLTGQIFLLGVPPHRMLSLRYVVLLLSVDSVFAFSTGLLLGGNLGIYLRYRDERRAAAASGPPPTEI